MTKTISYSLQRVGDKHVVKMTASGLEDERFEFDSEDDARSALQTALERAKQLQADGMILSIHISGELIPETVA